MTYPQPIALADITPGMDILTTTTWTATGATSSTRGIVTTAGTSLIRFNNALTSPTDTTSPAGATVTYQLMAAPPVDVPEPANGTILLDEAGAAWQNLNGVWFSINGDRLTWAEFLNAHPSYAQQQDTPVVPLPDPPPAGYPVAIAPDAARIGMDVRVTATYDAGGSKVARGTCVWNQNDPPPDDDIPSFFSLPQLDGSQGVGDAQWADLAANNAAFRDLFAGRFNVQYDPPPTGVTIAVEQMQDWTADTTWDVNVPEPPVGAVVRSRYGIAWQRTGDATEDDPGSNGGTWYLSGQGLWSSVTGDYPRSFLWLWGAAAPFNTQEAAP